MSNRHRTREAENEGLMRDGIVPRSVKFARKFVSLGAGGVLGYAASRTLPVATTLADALQGAGIDPLSAEISITALFVAGGIEGAFLAGPLVRRVVAYKS